MYNDLVYNKKTEIALRFSLRKLEFAKILLCVNPKQRLCVLEIL